MISPARPRGFTFLALCLTITAVVGLVPLASGGAERGSAALPLLIAVFAAVAAEALWNCRAWCVRAVVAFGCVRLLQPVSWMVDNDANARATAIVSFVVLAFIVAIMVGYVQNRAARLFASPGPRIPVPAPRP